MTALPFLLFTMMISVTYGSPLHLDLEMSSEEYRVLLNKMNSQAVNKMTGDHPSINEALRLGERLSKWIAKVNELRTSQTAIRLTSPSTRRGIPIDTPNTYSPDIIKKETYGILGELPTAMKEVLTGNFELPTTLPVDDETFITLARRLDRNYQSAARFKSVDQYRSYYIQAASKDVRGYYYLTKNSIGEDDLSDVSRIREDKITPTKNALALICLNNLGNDQLCRSIVNEAFENNTVARFYRKYFPAAKKNWNSFFKIPLNARREDIQWSAKRTTIPFKIPEIPKFIPYLRDNIEDEFRWKNWELVLNFGTLPGSAYLKFRPGVVPHVDRLGGNEIVMDSNQPIEEYESQWTIRHEFGHVLGLPDCYHEFYDLNAQAYVNYQLDITDLMCSRAGNMNERIFEELKKAYSK
jgi:hypothetical protein